MPAREAFAIDRVLKDLFQVDQPQLLTELTGGAAIREFLNVEFPRVMERRADLVALLADGSVFHFEFQTGNDRNMPYRMGIYALLIGQRYRRRVRQTVLYVGSPKMRMKPEVDVGGTQVSFRLLDIRDLDASQLLASHCPADWALAMLARGGDARLPEIARRVVSLDEAERERILTQMALLSGLRNMSKKLRMEMKAMGSLRAQFQNNVFLQEWYEEATAKGVAAGMAEGIAKGESFGMAKVLRGQLLVKFGRIPRWAERRLKTAQAEEIELWSKNFVTAERFDEVIPRQ